MTNKNIVAWKATTHNPIRINAQKIKDLQMGEGICRSLKPDIKRCRNKEEKKNRKKHYLMWVICQGINQTI
jgi:hypothetical protein